MTKGCFMNNSIAFVTLVITICCLMVIVISALKLPQVSRSKAMVRGSYGSLRKRKVAKDDDDDIGKFGEMMIEMLPEDLAFTIFLPSERAFGRDLRLHVNASFAAEKRNDTYAVVSRILSFSAVPRTLSSTLLPFSGEKVSFDSLSGFTLYISKDIDGMLLVNRIRSEKVDITRRDVVVHIMDGVIMDAEFQQSVQPDDELLD